MILQTSLIEFNILTPLVEIIFFIFLMVLMLYCNNKMDGFWLMSIILMFSVIIGLISITNMLLPFTPYIQSFFIIFQSIILLFKILNLS